MRLRTLWILLLVANSGPALSQGRVHPSNIVPNSGLWAFGPGTVQSGTLDADINLISPLLTVGTTGVTGTVSFNGTWVFNPALPFSLNSHNHTGVYQPVDADLTRIAGLVPTANGQVLKWDSVNARWTFAIDENTTYDLAPYLTSAIAANTYQPKNANLTDIAALNPTTTGLILKWDDALVAWVLANDEGITQAVADPLYVNVTGDTLTGLLTVRDPNNILNQTRMGYGEILIAKEIGGSGVEVALSVDANENLTVGGIQIPAGGKIITPGLQVTGGTPTVGHVLTATDTAGTVAWAPLPAAGEAGTGTVTNIATGTGLTGGPITDTGTIALNTTGAVNGEFLRYNTDGTVTWESVPAGGGTWGSITGTLSAQTDLNDALALKAPLDSPTFTGTVSGISAAMVGAQPSATILTQLSAVTNAQNGDILKYNGSAWVLGSDNVGTGGTGAPTDATYIVQTGHGDLTNEQALANLATGLVKVTNGTGVLSTAAAGTDYLAPNGDISGVTGTLNDARLSANVPLKNAANYFSGLQYIQTLSADPWGAGLTVLKRGATGDANAAIASGTEIGYHSFQGWDGTVFGRAAYVLVTANQTFESGKHGAKYQIATTANDSNDATVRLTVAHNGLIGVGTTSPTYSLHVAPTTGATAGQTAIFQDATATTGATKVVVKAGAGQSATRLFEAQDTGGSALAYIGSAGSGYFASSLLTGSTVGVGGAIYRNGYGLADSSIIPTNTGTQITRNIADANPALLVNQVHADSTGNILTLQKSGATKAAVDVTGKGSFDGGLKIGTSSTDGYVWTATDALGNGAWEAATGGAGLVAGGSLVGGLDTQNLYTFSGNAYHTTANTYAAIVGGNTDAGNNQIGVKGLSVAGHGVYGQANNSSAYGVYGKNLGSGAGIYGESVSGGGVAGYTASGTYGVSGAHYGNTGPGMYAVGAGTYAAFRARTFHASADIAIFEDSDSINAKITNTGKGEFNGGIKIGTSSTAGYVWTATDTAGNGQWAASTGSGDAMLAGGTSETPQSWSGYNSFANPVYNEDGGFVTRVTGFYTGTFSPIQLQLSDLVNGKVARLGLSSGKLTLEGTDGIKLGPNGGSATGYVWTATDENGNGGWAPATGGATIASTTYLLKGDGAGNAIAATDKVTITADGDVVINDALAGIILKSANAHYWRITVNDDGTLTRTDLGTTAP